MATIVQRVSDHAVFVLLGSGFAAYKATRPGVFFGNLAPHEDFDQLAVVAVSDTEGRIGWIASEELRVVSVDGATPGSLLASVTGLER